MEQTIQSKSADRIAKRRLRLQARKNKQAQQQQGKDDEVEEIKEISQSKAKIKEARGIFDDVIYNAVEDVVEVKLNREHEAMVRRREEKRLQKERVMKLEQEMLESAEKEEEIEKQWVGGIMKIFIIQLFNY